MHHINNYLAKYQRIVDDHAQLEVEQLKENE